MTALAEPRASAEPGRRIVARARAALACPHCRGDLQDLPAELACADCGRRYPAPDGRPDLRPQEPIQVAIEVTLPVTSDRRGEDRVGPMPVKVGASARLAGLARLFIRGAGKLSAGVWGPTDGCIGLTNEDVELVFETVRVGTEVTIEP